MAGILTMGQLYELRTLEMNGLKKLEHPPQWLSEFREVAFFSYDPETLAGLQTVKQVFKDEEAWYFFSKPCTDGVNVVGHGCWDLIAVMDIRNVYGIAGTRSDYNYFEGTRERRKTGWFMSEYRDLEHQPDQWLLFKLYQKKRRVTAAVLSSVVGNTKDDRDTDDADTASSRDPRQKGVQSGMRPKF